MKKGLKRALTLVLAMLMLCAMLPAALAADTDLPLYEQFGYDSAEEFMTYNWFSKADYDWVCERFAYHYARILADPQIALDYYGITREDVEQGIEWGDWESEDAFYKEIALWLVQDDEYLYVPALSVQLNGEKVVFPDAQPEMTNERTMVPFRAIAEAMGAEVSYDNGAIDAALGGQTLRLCIGEAVCWLDLPDGQQPPEGFVAQEDGEYGFAREIDAAPYLKDDRTYVPVRFFAEAFGLTVKWDEWRQTAVLYDRAALVRSVDERFGVLNQWLAAQPEPEQAQAMLTAAAAAVEYTALDSLDGDKTYRMSGTLEVLTEDGSVEMNIELDIGALVYLIGMDDYGDMDGLLGQLAEGLKNASFKMRYDAEEDVTYLYCPLLLKAIAADSEKDPETDIWLRCEGLGDLIGINAIDELNELRGGGTVGELLVSQNEVLTEYTLYQAVLDDADELAEVLGDDQFTRNGSKYTIQIDESYESGDDWLDYAEKTSGTVTFDVSTGAVTGEIVSRTDSWSGASETTCVFEVKGTGGRIELTEHTRNKSIIKATVTLKVSAAGRSPIKQPPAGETVVELEEWMDQLYDWDIAE